MYALDTKDEYELLFQTIWKLQVVEGFEDIVTLAKQKLEELFAGIEEGEWQKEYKFGKGKLVYYPNGLIESCGDEDCFYPHGRLILSSWESGYVEEAEEDKWKKEVEERKRLFHKTLQKKHPLWELQYRVFKGEIIKKRKIDVQNIWNKKIEMEKRFNELKKNEEAVKAIDVNALQEEMEKTSYKQGIYLFNQIIPKELHDACNYDSFLFTLTKEELQVIDEYYELATDKKTKTYSKIEWDFVDYLKKIAKEQKEIANKWYEGKERAGELIGEVNYFKRRIESLEHPGMFYSTNAEMTKEELIKELELVYNQIEEFKQKREFDIWAKEAFEDRFMIDCDKTIEDSYEGHRYKFETFLYVVEKMKESTNEEIQKIYQLFIKN